MSERSVEPEFLALGIRGIGRVCRCLGIGYLCRLVVLVVRRSGGSGDSEGCPTSARQHAGADVCRVWTVYVHAGTVRQSRW